MKSRRRGPRRLAFAVVALLSATSLLAAAQARKGAKPAATTPSPVKKPPAPAKPAHHEDVDKDARDASLATSAERAAPPTSAASGGRDGGAGQGGVVEQKGDGGARAFRFGEVEVEGRLKSPQIVYFLRRVRAEFAAGDLGHRTFLRELGETRNEQAF